MTFKPVSSLLVTVIMERRQLNSRWRSEEWQACGVVLESGDGDPEARVIFDDGRLQRVLHPGFSVDLYRDEAENYWLNVSATEPKVFVLWRQEDGVVRPALVTVSFGEAARWMDSNEQVDGVPMPPEIYRWVGEFVETYYRPEEPTKKKRGRRYATASERKDY